MIRIGDCLDVMRTMPSDSIDLIVTSPPYAMMRAKQYGGVPEDEYVGWWMPRAEQMKRLLKPGGSLIVNIKECVWGGRRSLYVLDLVQSMVRRQSWFWLDSFAWLKTTVHPGSWPNRLKDGWEPLYHFAKTKDIKFRPKNVLRPAAASSLIAAKYWTPKYAKPARTGSAVYSAHNRPFTNDVVRPSNVIMTANSHSSENHPAQFPEDIPEFFVRLLTDEGDAVLDPFAGSGTTVRAARRLGRRAVGIEVKKSYVVPPPAAGQTTM